MDQFVHWNQLLAHAISFLIFFFLVRGAFMAIIYPPMRERRERIKAEYERIEQEKSAVADLKHQYEGHIKKIEAESRERIQAAVAEGQRVGTEMRDLARKEAQETLTRAREEIGLERDKARIMLRDDVVKLAMDIAGKVVHEELDAEKHKKLVDAFLKEVESAR
ncbi:MAG: F0F1 ATP synthase subunit B [Candidatus Eisenbacteria bacterium]